MKILALRTAVFLGLAALLGGCAVLGLDGRQPAPPAPFTDIPLPEEMEPDPESIQVFKSTLGGQVGHLKASGDLSADQLLLYYRQAMLQHGWSRDLEAMEEQIHRLVFKKEPRTATIWIEEGWLGSELALEVSATVP